MTRAPIDARTRLVGVIGWPIEHSLSPAMHNAALAALGLNWRYVAMPVRPGEVTAAVRGMAALGFRGCNVTVPHKAAVLAELDAVARDAAVLGAANTLVMSRDAGGCRHIAGHNTDVAGFLGALRAGGCAPQGREAVVVGAGGAARAVVYGLLWAGAARVTVLNRTPARAERLAMELTPPQAEAIPPLEAGALTPAALVEAAQGADLLVNATTVGMWPQVDGSVWPEDVPVPAHLTVYDLVYNPLETRLLRQARAAGARALDGLGMLARQGALALDRWTDAALDVDAVTAQMEETCRRAIGASPRARRANPSTS